MPHHSIDEPPRVDYREAHLVRCLENHIRCLDCAGCGCEHVFAAILDGVRAEDLAPEIPPAELEAAFRLRYRTT